MSSETVLVTGASRGIGRATAIQLSEDGRNIVVNYNNSGQKAEDVVSKVRDRNANGVALQADVSDPESVTKLVDEANSRFGTIDYLVNNAGMIARPGHWKELDMEQWQETISVNLTGVFNCIREVAPDMIKNGGGKIVNISSTYAFLGAPIVAYTAAKAGVLNLTTSFAKELAPEVTVNAVVPGNIDTDMTRAAGNEFINQIVEETPLNRLGSPEDVAGVIEFLLSEKGDFITGESIVVDGGHQLR